MDFNAIFCSLRNGIQVAFKKTFSYAGFEQQPKHFDHPKILLLNVELELKVIYREPQATEVNANILQYQSEKENAEVRITDVDQYQSIVDAEWGIIYEKLEKCVSAGRSDTRDAISKLLTLWTLSQALRLCYRNFQSATWQRNISQVLCLIWRI
jgi:hypothetical protein